MNLVIDTNTLYNPGQLRRLGQQPEIRLWASVANFIEVISDPVDDETLRRAQGQLRLIQEVCESEILPDLDSLFLRALRLAWASEERELLDGIVPHVLAAADYATCHADVEKVREARARHARTFRSGVEQVILLSNPQADVSDSGWHVNVGRERLAEIEAELTADGFRYAVAGLFYLRLGRRLPATINVGEVLRVSDLYARAYRGWLIRTFANGRKPEPNDAIDLHFFIPIQASGWALLTEEGQIRKIAKQGGVPDEKLRRFSDF